jgi:hypothetical protein
MGCGGGEVSRVYAIPLTNILGAAVFIKVGILLINMGSTNYSGGT